MEQGFASPSPRLVEPPQRKASRTIGDSDRSSQPGSAATQHHVQHRLKRAEVDIGI